MTRLFATISASILLALVVGCGDNAVAPPELAPTLAWSAHGSPQFLAISPDGNTLVAHMGTQIGFFYASTGDSLARTVIDRCCGCGCLITPSNVAMSPDGKEVAAGATSILYLINSPSGAIRDTIATGSFSLTDCVSYGPDGSLYVLSQFG